MVLLSPRTAPQLTWRVVNDVSKEPPITIFRADLLSLRPTTRLHGVINLQTIYVPASLALKSHAHCRQVTAASHSRSAYTFSNLAFHPQVANLTGFQYKQQKQEKLQTSQGRMGE